MHIEQPGMSSGKSDFRVLLVSSSGGVLLDLLALKPWWQLHKVKWAVVSAVDTVSVFENENVYWMQECSLKTPVRLLKYIYSAGRILRREKIDLVLSSGTGIAIPFFVASTALGIPRIWLETFNIINKPGTTSRICSKLANEVLIQRESLKSSYPHAHVIGELY